MGKRGTAAYNLGQYNQVLGALQLALPRALQDTDPRKLIPVLQKNGEGVEEGLGQLLRLLQEGTAPVVATVTRVRQQVFPVRLEYNNLAEAKAGGGFIYVNPNITDANFPQVLGKGLVESEAVAVNFGEYVESEDAVSRLNAIGLRAGVPKELADLSKGHPDSQLLAACMPLVALGASWRDPDGNRYVAYLDGIASHRELDLDLWRYGWAGHWWFLAFRK